MSDAPKGRLREDVVRKALASLDWASFKNHLTEIDLDEEAVDAIVDNVRRSGDFMIKRQDAKRRAARVEFVENLFRHLAHHQGELASDRLRKTVVLIETIEHGYLSIMATLAKAEVSKLPPQTQIWAAIARAGTRYLELERLKDDALGRKNEFSPQTFTMTLEDGQAWAPDALLTSIVGITTSTLLLSGHANGWFDCDYLVVPTRVQTTEEERYKAGSTELLASWWGQWQDLEQRCRHLGGDLSVYEGNNLPEWAPADAARVIVHDYFGDVELLDLMANQRHSERMVQTFHAMRAETNMEARAQGIGEPTELPPNSFVSATEAHACVMLSQLLGYSITDDSGRPGGLRLVEWIRGYATLRCIAEGRLASAPINGPITEITRTELVATLERVGLKGSDAETFIDRATLHKSSRDLFDQPLIRLQNGSLLLFGPGVLAADPARVALSAIANLGVQLERKGKAFETETLRKFQAIGFDAKAFKFKVGDEEYEFDVVVPWGDHIFLLECKNRSLSGNGPVQAAYFFMAMTSAVGQTLRLADGMRRHADIVLQVSGIDVSGKTIVPCVLNSLPYSWKGALSGAYVTDASSLSRFFSERHFHAIHERRAPDGTIERIMKPLAALWKGEQPTPEDLVLYLGDPLQLKLMFARAELKAHHFGLDGRTLVSAKRIHFNEVTTERLIELFAPGQTEEPINAT